MGVDYYTCPICDHNYPDCGDVFTCYPGCESNFCSSECASIEYSNGDQEDDEEKQTCVLCRKENATDYDLLNALLKHFAINRNEALEIYKKQS